jgi:plasmid replication initiation protein
LYLTSQKIKLVLNKTKGVKMNDKNLVICKSNKVIEAGYKLSLNEQRVILCCIAQVNSSKPLSATERLEVTAQDFSDRFQISKDKSYQTLKEVSEQLFERYVIIDNPDPADKSLRYTKTRWISAVNYHTDIGKISLLFAPLMIPYLSELTGNFTFYQLEHIGAMSSIYALRLYELLMQWKTTGKREIEIDWLKKQFELDANYGRMFDLKKYVITPAVKEINQYSNFNVTWEQRKTGRKVTHLTFTFYEKPPEVEKPKRTTKPKEKTVYGVPMSEINKRALAGEKVEDAAARINRENEAKSTPPTPVKPTEPATRKPKAEKPSKETNEQKAARFAALKNATKGR